MIGWRYRERRDPMIRFLPIFLTCLWATAAVADCPNSIVTGIDVSALISHDELLMQVDRMVAALHSPAVISAIQSRGCARFSVFVWGDQAPVVLLPWTDIGSDEQAEQASAKLLAAAGDYQVPGGQLTDVSSALQFAWQLLEQAPPTGRQVVNIISNGESNRGPHPSILRTNMLAENITINAVVFGPAENLDTWYRGNVTGGLGSFVMRIHGIEDVAAAYRSKFVMDLAQVTE